MGKVIEIQKVSYRQKPEERKQEEWNPEGWWIISVNLTESGNKVEYRESHGVMVHAKSLRELPALIEQGRKLLARGSAVRATAGRR